ncbi:MAG: tetratricopeptide repeat protein [Pirellulales bacterium]
MIHRNVVLSGLLAMACVGVLQAADDAQPYRRQIRQELATKAWVALKAGDHEQVSELTTQCFEEFGNEAVKQQKESGEEISKDNAHSFPELNSVGTCLFILAESLSQQGKDEKSQATLQKLITDFPECHCENKEGYYWKPALAAEKRLAEAPENSG